MDNQNEQKNETNGLKEEALQQDDSQEMETAQDDAHESGKKIKRSNLISIIVIAAVVILIIISLDVGSCDGASCNSPIGFDLFQTLD